MIIGALKPDEVIGYWKILEWAFEEFSRSTHGEVAPDDLADEIINGERHCWVAMEGSDVIGVALTRVCGNLNRLWIEYCTGRDRGKWQAETLHKIEEWARQNDLPGVVVFCRPGWKRFLSQEGYRETHRILEKEFT